MYKRQEKIRAEKLHIADTIGEQGALYLNGDDPMLQQLRESYTGNIVWYGLESDCDYQAVNIDTVKDCTRFELHAPFGAHKIMIPALGLHNVSNALAAIAAVSYTHLDVYKRQHEHTARPYPSGIINHIVHQHLVVPLKAFVAYAFQQVF